MSGILSGTPLERRLLFPIRVLAATGSGPKWRRQSTIDVRQLVNEPLLLLRQDFGSRQLFGFRLPHRPYSAAHRPGKRRAEFADRAGGSGSRDRGRAIDRAAGLAAIRLIPILVKGKSLGTWGSIVWDARRALPIYAASFIEELTTYAQHRLSLENVSTE